MRVNDCGSENRHMIAGAPTHPPTKSGASTMSGVGWLAGEEIPLVPFDSERMTARPISTTINNVKNQGPQCVEAR